MTWMGDWAPSAEGYGGVDGDCPQCGEKLMWTGWGWSVHSVGYHQGVRRRLLRAVRELVAREAELRVWEAQNAAEGFAQGFVGVRWRCGVYPGWQSEERSRVPWSTWDKGERWQDEYLRDSRSILSAWWELRHGVKVNPATWFHKVYDPRVGGEKP